jgi:hypothetical protein
MTGSDVALVGSGAFAFTASGCIITYTGPNIRVEVSADCSFTTVSLGRTGFGIAKSGDLVGLSLNNNNAYKAGVGFDTDGGAGSEAQLSTLRVLDLTTGDTIRPVMACDTADTHLVSTLSISVVQIPT